MKKYVAHLCEDARIELSEERYLRKPETTVFYENELITCREIVVENNKGKDFFIMFPVDSFEVVEDE